VDQRECRLKILTLSNSPLEETQGSGYVIMGYANRLRDRGHRVDLIDPRDLEFPKHGRRGIRYRKMIGMAMKSVDSLASGYDILEFYGGEAWLAISLLRRVRNRPALIAHSNGLEPLASLLLRQASIGEDNSSGRWYHADLSSLYARSFTAADAVVTVSEFDRDFAQRSGYQPVHRLMAVENPLPDSYLSQPLVHERPPCLVFCGSWIRRKGIDLLCRDVSRFLSANLEWRLVLAGVGNDIRASNYFPVSIIDRIEVIPYVDRETELKEIYLRSRIAIQTSIYESFGLAASEAMACGCALVATKVGFAASLTDGEEALLFPSAANPSLIDCLSRFASDKSFRLRVAEGGYRRVQGLRWDSAVNRIEAAYQTWIHDRRGVKRERSALQ
jgi:glycosyltransferase involved in cell wall biosynthesis